MARGTFGGSSSDFTFTVAAGGLMRLSPATLTFWSAETGGVQYTDLLLGGLPVTQINVGADGQIPAFEGPDNILTLWASANAGADRTLLVANQAATSTALQAHLVDADDAHDASAISYVPTGGVAATEVQAAITELDNEKVNRALVDAKGDLLVGSANDTLIRLAAGADGSMLVADSAQAGGLRWSTTKQLEGAGSPAGVVSAAIGTMYRDTAATTGAVLWVKTTASGTSGWQVVYGDTDWRDVSALLATGWELAPTAAAFKLRRVGRMVSFIARISPTATSPLIGTARMGTTSTIVDDVSLAGWFPSGGVVTALAARSNAASSAYARAATNQRLDLNIAYDTGNWADADQIVLTGTWTSDQAWPTTLPGVAG